MAGEEYNLTSAPHLHPFSQPDALTSQATANTTGVDTSHKQFYESAKEVTGLYLFPILCVTGILGNILAFIVFTKFKVRSTTNVYLTALAVSDTIKLLCDFLYFVVVFLDKIDMCDTSHAVYVTLYPYAHYILNFSLCNTAWLTVSVAVERYIYMKWPERATVICTVRRAILTCVVVWIVVMLVNVPFLLRYNREEVNGETDVIPSPLWQNDEFKQSYVWVQNIIRSIIPLVVLIYINTWIIVTLSRSSREYYQRPLACKNRVTIMLIAVLITYLICITPDAIMSAFLGFGYRDGSYLIRGIREYSDVLLCLNSAINFFLYFGFNKVFRHNFARVFCKNYYWQRLAQTDDGAISVGPKTYATEL